MKLIVLAVFLAAISLASAKHSYRPKHYRKGRAVSLDTTQKPVATTVPAPIPSTQKPLTSTYKITNGILNTPITTIAGAIPSTQKPITDVPIAHVKVDSPAIDGLTDKISYNIEKGLGHKKNFKSEKSHKNDDDSSSDEDESKEKNEHSSKKKLNMEN